MNSRLASRRLSSEKSSVLTKEALQDLNLQDFDVMEGWEPTPGKVYTKVRAISARINQNYDAWPSDELKKSYRTFLGKPVFVNHVNDDPRKARGVVVAARFVENGDDKYVEVIQEVDADRFPMLAHELVTGGLDSVSMGAEARICKCSYCGNEANDMLTMCSHVLGQKGQILGKVNEDGTREDILVYEECRDISFFELSYVFDPADETAVVSNVLTANKKRGYGETALPPQVDTLRDEEEDLGSYFIEPPEEFQEPDLDKEYPDIDRGESSPDRRGEEQREDYDMARVSRRSRRGRNLSRRRHAREYTPEDWEALEWDNQYVPFAVGEEMHGDDFAFAPPGTAIGAEAEDGSGETYEIVKGRDGGWYNNDYKVNLHWEEVGSGVVSRSPKTSNRRSRDMSRNNRMSRRRRYAEEYGRNDQGEQEEVYISQTPPAEPLETGAGASDAPNNSQGDRVKTDRNRSTHTNFEARRRRSNRRRSRRHANGVARAYDWDGNEVDVADTWQTAEELARAGYDVEAIGDDTEFGVSREEIQQGIDNIRGEIENYEYFEDSYGGGKSYDHPAPRRRSNRRRANGVARAYDWDGNEVDVANTWQTAEELARAGYDVEAIGDDTEFGVSREEIQQGIDNIRREVENYDYFEDSYGGGKSYDHPAPRRRARRRVASPDVYRDFLEYAQGQGADLDYMQQMYDKNYESNGMDDEADRAVYELETMMSDYAGGDDDVFYQLLDAPGSYEINHPNNFRGASRKRRSRRRSNRRKRANDAPYNLILDNGKSYPIHDGGDLTHWAKDRYYGDYDQLDRLDELADIIDSGGLGHDHANALGLTIERNASRKRRRARRRRIANPTRLLTDDLAEMAGLSVPLASGWEVINNPNLPSPILYKEITDFDGLEVSPLDDGSFSWAVTRGMKRAESGFAHSVEEAQAQAEAAYGQRSASRRRMSAFDPNISDDDLLGGAQIAEVLQNAYPDDLESRDKFQELIEEANNRGLDYEQWKKRRARRRMAEQSDDFDLNSRADIARNVEDEDLFEAPAETQPKDASRKRRRARRRVANGLNEQDLADMADGSTIIQNHPEFGEVQLTKSNGRWVNRDQKADMASEELAANPELLRRARRRRRMADTNLDLAAPDGRVNVEAPVSGVTDADAQASQFDKGDYGHNAGDGLADPDLSTDQNWAPGEGKTSTRKASQIEGMRLAEAMVEAGLEKHDDRWKLAESYTKLPAAIVRDRITLLSRTASVKTPSRDDNGQRPMKSARKSPGLGNGPSLRKVADNKTDDYSLYF